MEGVLDPLVRALLTRINPYDLCISEFLRVTDKVLPSKVFYRYCPELYQGGLTSSGTPVRVQLLGQSPEYLAENAYKAIELGSHGIDLNCGCPSKLVNGHGGGATLLKTPDLIYQAVSHMVRAIPANQVVSVKIRLGWETDKHAYEIADAAFQGGAKLLTVHGRTKQDGYQANKINWPAIANIRKKLPIDVVANGEIWDRASAERCLLITGCRSLMIGRGALATPNLAEVIKQDVPNLEWRKVIALFIDYFALEKPGDNGLYHMARTKQWLNFLRITYPEAQVIFSQIRPMQQIKDIQTTFLAALSDMNR
ncbi:tRNA-U20a,U20b-dihydrouridine synthase [Thorsellia anophelis DSM 18579]|uniref:tRNA-dihydrouridine(16) synthase n=2 Tax=Thorsellia anophelis TaxID=336804 RepID=A0A1H9ZVI3_9GAMM|nr:tRNA-U20a,U20b-dihydrouridine synthase [Thorsellia anophelis DSM 18579]